MTRHYHPSGQETMSFLEGDSVRSTAIVSIDGKYRYRLGRVWDPALGFVCFVMLNPSTADANIDDPTVRKCMMFGRAWGYGGIEVVNAFAMRTSMPSVMRVAHREGFDVVGPNNDGYIVEAITAPSCRRVVAAWGRMPKGLEARERAMRLLLTKHVDVDALRLLAPIEGTESTPGHPLYLSNDTVPVRWLSRSALSAVP